MRKRPANSSWIRLSAAAAMLLACAGPAFGQLLGGGLGGGLGDIAGGRAAGLGGGLTGSLSRPLSEVTGAAHGALAEVRREAAARLIHEHPEALEADAHGAPVVRGEVLALTPSDQALAAARAAGFRVGARTSAPDLGLDSVTLLAPPGLSALEALRKLRKLDPQGQYDLDHIYQEGGVSRSGDGSGIATGCGPASGLRTDAVWGRKTWLV